MGIEKDVEEFYNIFEIKDGSYKWMGPVDHMSQGSAVSSTGNCLRTGKEGVDQTEGHVHHKVGRGAQPG